MPATGCTARTTGNLDPDSAARIAAVAAGLVALAHSVEPDLDGDGPFRDALITWDTGFLALRDASNGSRLVVHIGPAADIGLVAQAMAEVVQRNELALHTPARD